MTESTRKPFVTIPNECKRNMNISFEVPFEVVCSIPLKPFGGKVYVDYIPGETLIEWNSFAKYIEEQRGTILSAEEFAEVVFDVIERFVQPRYLLVRLDIDSAFHLDVDVEVCSHEQEDGSFCDSSHKSFAFME